MTLAQNNITAVVLSGGGAHGAYEVGVLKALMTGASWTTGNLQLAPDILMGTSIGAFNSAMLLSRLDEEGPAATAKYLEDVWVNVIPAKGDTGHNHVFRFRGNPGGFFNLDVVRHPAQTATLFSQDAAFFAEDWLQRGRTFFSASGTLTQRSVELIDLSTLISREPSVRLLQKTVVLENIRRSRRLLFIPVTNWQSGKVEFFRSGDLTDEIGIQVLMASSAIPGIFPPVTIEGKIYVDGGLALNTTLGPAFVEAVPGADTAHVIYLDPKTENIPLQPLQSTIGTMDRLITIGLSKSIDSDMRIASRVNRGLELVEKASQGMRVAQSDVIGLIQSASYLIDGIGGRLPESPKTIHRYRPSKYLGGTLSLLNFNRTQMIDLIELGFRDVMQHDCQVNECVLPGGLPIEAVKKPWERTR